jgi:hypothetical protein
MAKCAACSLLLGEKEKATFNSLATVPWSKSHWAEVWSCLGAETQSTLEPPSEARRVLLLGLPV